jgi:hypothetical protein
MKRWSVVLLGSLLCALTAFAQQPTQLSAENGVLFSSDLVMWSYMQEPQLQEQDHPHQQPTPEPTPETQPTPDQTPAQPEAKHTSPAEPESQSQSPAQTFTGTVSKEADTYVLKVTDTTSYKLDNDEQVQPYEGRRVQVTGTLDSSSNLIHVEKVEPLS